jgi:hypothetical protein
MKINNPPISVTIPVKCKTCSETFDVTIYPEDGYMAGDDYFKLNIMSDCSITVDFYCSDTCREKEM